MNPEDGLSRLNQIDSMLERGAFAQGMDHLFGCLLDLREELSEEDWRRFAKEIVVDHPVRTKIHLDPMTRRSFEKPRGYAGDAVLLDYIYGYRQPGREDAGPAGRAVYEFATERPAAQAVRRRRDWIAQRLDRVAAESERPLRVLSIASGHLREAHDCRALDQGRIEEYVALDSDGDSCSFIEETFPGVTTRNVSFTALFRDRGYGEHFDFVYSAGLYDYLEDRLARKLTHRMFQMLRPGGRLFLTNFLPSVVDAGYMESFMGWDLIYRDRHQIAELAADIDLDRIRELRVFADSQRAIGYLEVQRR